MRLEKSAKHSGIMGRKQRSGREEEFGLFVSKN